MKITILGATGFVGTALTLKLLDAGHTVKALSRTPERWPLQHHNLSVVKGDVADPHALEEVLKGSDVAYYLVHGLGEEEDDFEFVEARGATNFVQVAAKQKVRKVIYLGGLGPDEGVSKHLRSRHLVGDILGLLPGACLEFRASIVLGAQSTSFEMIKALTYRLPVRPYAQWLETPCQPIALKDLLAYLTAGLECDVLGHTVIEIGAPQVLGYGELLDLAIKHEGLTRAKFLLPPADRKVFHPLIDLVVPEFSEVGKKLFDSLSTPTVVTDTKADELFPDIKAISVEDALKEAFAESHTTYHALWEGDFWKEILDQTLLQTRHGQQALIDKMKQLATRLPRRKKS